MNYYMGETEKIDEFLCIPKGTLFNVCESHRDENCFLTLILISSLGQRVLKIRYGNLNSKCEYQYATSPDFSRLIRSRSILK